MYKEGDASTIRDIEFEGMTLIGLLKKLKGACQFPVEGIYFLIPGKELSNGLVEIKDDSNLAECIVLAFKTEKLIKIYLEHHGYDLSHWVQTKIKDDEVSDVGEMEDISAYGPCDFVRGNDVVIPNRTINDFFLNKSCNGTVISDQTGIPKCSEPTDKELLIDSDDKGVDTRNDYQNFMVLCGRAIAEGRCGGKKGNKGNKGNKGKKGVQSLGKKGKGVQIPGKKDKGVQSLGKKGKGVQSLSKKGKGVQSPGKKRQGCAESCISQCKRAKQRSLFDHEGGLIERYSRPDATPGCIFDYHFRWSQGSTNQHQFYTKMNLIGNIDPEAKQWVVDRNLNSWCRAFFKMDRGCGAYENGISESYHNSIRIAKDTITPSIRKRIEHLKITQRYWTVFPCGDNRYEIRKGDESFGVNIENRTCSCNWWTLSGVPCVHTVAAYCFIKSDPTLAGSATAVDESGPTDVDESGQTVVDESGVEIQMEATITEDPIQEFKNEIPTQTSRTSIKEVVEAFTTAGTLKLAGLKRRSKSERIANRAKAFKFGKDGAGSSANKAWDVDEVLADQDVVF
nr:60S ribosomal protein L34 [Tanacetum cinerariifolium]